VLSTIIFQQDRPYRYAALSSLVAAARRCNLKKIANQPQRYPVWKTVAFDQDYHPRV